MRRHWTICLVLAAFQFAVLPPRSAYGDSDVRVLSHRPAADANASQTLLGSLPHPRGRDDRLGISSQTARQDVALIAANIGGRIRLCSGILLSSRIVVTAGRCAHSGPGGQWALEYTVVPGYGLSPAPIGEATGALLYAFSPWIERGDTSYDVAFVVLDRDVASVSGFASAARSEGCAGIPGSRMSLSGYTSGGLVPSTEEYTVQECSDAHLTVHSEREAMLAGAAMIGADGRVHAIEDLYQGGTRRPTRFNPSVYDFLIHTLLPSVEPCAIELEADVLEVGSADASARVAVIAPTGCSWPVRSEASWLSVSPSSGIGIGQASVQISSNPGAARTARASLGGRQLTVRQEGAGTSGNISFAAAARLGGGFVSTTAFLPSPPTRPDQSNLRRPESDASMWWRWVAPTTARSVVAADVDGARPTVRIHTGRNGNRLSAVVEGAGVVAFTAVAGVDYAISTSAADAGPRGLRLTVDQPMPGAEVQTGWWWNPAEPGRGFFIETNGTNVFAGTLIYDGNGDPTWYVSHGALYSRRFLTNALAAFADGSDVLGAFRTPRFDRQVGTLSLSLFGPSSGRLRLTSESIAIERFSFPASGLSADRQPFVPESGWWWNPAEPGIGYAIEVQGDRLMAGLLHFDTNGVARWSMAEGPMTDARTFDGTIVMFGNGQRPGSSHRLPDQVRVLGSVSISFLDASRAVLRLPNGRLIDIARFRF
jgi:hypothetical protein